MSAPPATDPAAAVASLPPAEWLRADDRVALLAHGQWGLFSTAKTGIQVIRFSLARVVGVVNPAAVGTDAAAAVDLPGKGPIPVVATLRELFARPEAAPTRVLVAVAPEGGRLPAAMRADIETAIAHGVPVLSGLHTFLADDSAFARLARKHGTPLVDLRRPPADAVAATGAGRLVPVPVIATVGTDCRCGKMTVAVALREAARAAGLRAAFVATGQTGLLLEPDAGAPIDRVVIDFVAGEVERQVLRAARLDAHGRATAATPDLILVEGQGALSHPAYAGVTAALLQGAWPDALVMCHVHGRTEKTIPTVGPRFPVLAVADEIRLVETFLSAGKPARVAAVALAAPRLDAGAHDAERRRLEAATGRPVTDVVREGGGRLLAIVMDAVRDAARGKAGTDHAPPLEGDRRQQGPTALRHRPLARPAASPAAGRADLRSLAAAERLRPVDWVVVLAHHRWGLFTAKTGVQVLRSSRARVIAVIDPDRLGEDAAALVGLPDKSPVPVHAELRPLLDAEPPPTRVVVGVAPPDGVLPEAMRDDVAAALAAGIPVLSGLHAPLAADRHLAGLAAKSGAAIVDLRVPPADPVVATGAGRRIPIPVVTTVGTDCNAGKMTVAVALREAARSAGLRAAFVATGQTGLLLEPDAGAPIDRVISDFVAGEVERQVLAAARLGDDGRPTPDSPDLILVEGQGALSHPAYGGVTAGILQGSWPSALVMCHVHGRDEKFYPTVGPPFPVLPVEDEKRLVEAFLAPVWPARVAAVALAAPGLSAGEYAAARDALATRIGVPVADVVREGAARILAALQAVLAETRATGPAVLPP